MTCQEYSHFSQDNVVRSFRLSSLLLCSTLFINCSAGPFGVNSNRKIVRMGLIDAGAAADMVEKSLDEADDETKSNLLLLAENTAV